MVREQFLNKLKTYTFILNPEKEVDNIEKELRKYNIGFENVNMFLVYNRDDEIEFSLMTKPEYHIHIHIKK